MNVKEYISTGILEQYVSGLISPQEKQEVECMSHIYPEIQTELDTLYEAFEAIAYDMQRTPPAYLKANIMNALSELTGEDEKLTLTATPASKPVAPDSANDEPRDNVRSMDTGWMRIAASVLLVLCLALGYLLFNKTRDVSSLKNEVALQRESNLKAEKTFTTLNKQIAVLSNANYQKINLAGIPDKSPASSVAVYWNKSSNEVFVASVKLPAAPPDKQYQLWAIADGKPVDIGMIENKASMDSVFQQMKNIQNPQAFAITLEKKGGVESPTMTEMYVLGKI